VRYFMMIPEAVELVIQAGAMAQGGEVFVLDMGKPVRIYDLAVKMINLSGLQVLDKENPGGDIEIQYTGLRPGEKLYEELLVGDAFSLTENKLIMRAKEEMISWDKLEPVLDELTKASLYNQTEEIYKLLKKLLPEFKKN
jgi:FlaA1/EpsC-like NDP-sugar epimerase